MKATTSNNELEIGIVDGFIYDKSIHGEGIRVSCFLGDTYAKLGAWLLIIYIYKVVMTLRYTTSSRTGCFSFSENWQNCPFSEPKGQPSQADENLYHPNFKEVVKHVIP